MRPSKRTTAVVWGLGRFGGGIGAALHLHRAGYGVRIVDREPAEALEKSLAALHHAGLETELRREEEGAFTGAGLVVVNPGVPPDHPLLAGLVRRGVHLTQELDLFLAAYPGRTIGVTGTNGKSTTSAMLHAALRASGHEVLLGGNIGRSLLVDADRWDARQWAVLEVSSFQAARLQTHPPRLGHLLITPITRDHLAWHGGLASYRRAKLRLKDAVLDRGWIVGLDSCPIFRHALDRPAGSRYVGRLGREPGLPRRIAGAVELGGRRLFGLTDLRMPGDFNLDNALLALAGATVCGADPVRAAEGIVAFPGLPHRLQPLGQRGGVRFVDNGASTIAETSLHALQTMGTHGPVRWVCGGRAKDPDLEPILRRLAGLAESVHAFGEVAPRLACSLAAAGHGRISRHASLLGALDRAWDSARPGDVVLLSPAFTSHDQYANFAARSAEAQGWWKGLRRPPGRRRLDRSES